MSCGHLPWPLTGKIDYKELRNTSSEAARQGVIEYWKSDGGNVSATTRLLWADQLTRHYCPRFACTHEERLFIPQEVT